MIKHNKCLLNLSSFVIPWLFLLDGGCSPVDPLISADKDILGYKQRAFARSKATASSQPNMPIQLGSRQRTVWNVENLRIIKKLKTMSARHSRHLLWSVISLLFKDIWATRVFGHLFAFISIWIKTIPVYHYVFFSFFFCKSVRINWLLITYK